MQTTSALCLLVILLSAIGASAQEAGLGTLPFNRHLESTKVVQLKQPIIGCEKKTDLRDFPSELPKAISLAEMPLPYREGRCIRLEPGRLIIAQVQGTYACLQQRQGHSCLWVRSEDAGVPIIGDFGPPGQGGGRTRGRDAPEFTPGK
jgi:hypothetical protein